MYDTSLSSSVIKHAYDGNSFINHKKNIIAIAYKHAERVDFYQFNKDSYSSKYFENQTKAIFDTMQISNSLSISSRNDKSIFSFYTGDSNQQYIYLIYSGNSSNSEKSISGNIILILDWNGNLVRRFELPFYTNAIAIGENENTLYLNEYNNKKIYKLIFHG